MIKKILATFISCFILVGLVVIYYWRDIQYQPEQQDLMVYLLILPVVLTLIILSPYLIYQAYQKYQDKRQQKLATESAQHIEIIEQPALVQPSQWLNLNLYVSGSYSALGENESILEQVKQFSAPKLDQQLSLKDSPVLSYRIETLDQHISPEQDGGESSLLSMRQQRIMALIDHQIAGYQQFLCAISDHLKRSSLFYESQNLHEYRVHPAWIDPTFSGDDDSESRPIEQVYRLDKLNLHILLSEDIIHTWDEQSSNEQIQTVFYELGIIPQKFYIEYHFLSMTSTAQHLMELLQRIQQQPHEVSLIIAVDSEIDPSIVDAKSWMTDTYIPAEFISSCCLTHPLVQLEQLSPLKTLKLVFNQNHLAPILKELELEDLPQYQDEQPFVLVLEDSKNVKVTKKLEQFFAQTPIEAHHYLYCTSVLGHTQHLAKIFGMLLATHLPEQQVAFVYAQDLKAFIQTFPEIEVDQNRVALAD